MTSLGIRIKKYTLMSNNQRSFFPVLYYELVAMNGFYLNMFHQMISISDCLCKLGYTKCKLKLIKVALIILTNVARIILELACKIF